MSIKIYSKTVCPKCMLIKSTLQSAGVDYKEINIDENEEAKNFIVNQGFLAVPIMEHEGQLIGDVSEMIKTISEIAE